MDKHNPSRPDLISFLNFKPWMFKLNMF